MLDEVRGPPSIALGFITEAATVAEVRAGNVAQKTHSLPIVQCSGQRGDFRRAQFVAQRRRPAGHADFFQEGFARLHVSVDDDYSLVTGKILGELGRELVNRHRLNAGREIGIEYLENAVGDPVVAS